MTDALHARLTSEPHALKVVFLSLDDLYLPHKELSALSQTNSKNAMLSGRGLPGTHDLPLGRQVLQSLREINAGKEKVVELPIYDKSQFGGKGDRARETKRVQGPLDLVIFEGQSHSACVCSESTRGSMRLGEGWMTGFYPLSEEEIQSAYANKQAPHQGSRPKEAPLGKRDLQGPFFTRHSLEDCLQVNESLKGYVEHIWPCLDCFVQIGPLDQGFTYEWRLQVRNSSTMDVNRYS